MALENIQAGDTLEFSVSLAEYPADVWTLTYSLLSDTNKITFAGSDNNQAHDFSVSAAITAGYTADNYTYVAQVSDGTDRFTVDSGTVKVLPDISAATTFDARTGNRKVLDVLYAARLELYESTAGVISVSHQGRAVSYDLDSLERQIAVYERKVQKEDLTNKGISSKIQVRF